MGEGSSATALLCQSAGTESEAERQEAMELFRTHISAISACAEAIAVAVGAPFLRCDFFVGGALLTDGGSCAVRLIRCGKVGHTGFLKLSVLTPDTASLFSSSICFFACLMRCSAL